MWENQRWVTIGKKGWVPATVNMIGNDPSEKAAGATASATSDGTGGNSEESGGSGSNGDRSSGGQRRSFGEMVSGLRSKANATLDEVNAKLDRMHQRTLQILTPHTRDSFDGASRSVDEYYWLNE